jgi:hypothetical protein
MTADRNESSRRAARIDEVFPHVLSGLTGEDRERSARQDVDDEERYLRERPPHHDRLY